MKKTLTILVAVVFLALAGSVSAATIDCLGVGNVIQVQANVTNSTTLTCDGLTFSNFYATNLSGQNAGRVDINGLTFDTVASTVYMNLNPGLGSAGHVDFYYTVRGGVLQLDLAVGGMGATVTERACTNPILQTGPIANLCPATPGGTTSTSPLGMVQAHSGDQPQPVFSAMFASASPIYVFKDIGTNTGGGLSTVTQSYHTPEPATFALLGAGLVAFGLFRRKRV